MSFIQSGSFLCTECFAVHYGYHACERALIAQCLSTVCDGKITRLAPRTKDSPGGTCERCGSTVFSNIRPMFEHGDAVNSFKLNELETEELDFPQIWARVTSMGHNARHRCMVALHSVAQWLRK